MGYALVRGRCKHRRHTYFLRLRKATGKTGFGPVKIVFALTVIPSTPVWISLSVSNASRDADVSELAVTAAVAIELDGLCPDDEMLAMLQAEEVLGVFTESDQYTYRKDMGKNTVRFFSLNRR